MFLCAPYSVKWLLSLGRDSVSEKWEPVHGDLERNALRHMVKDELSFKFRQGNLMDQVGILSAQVKECFQEVAGTLRREDVTDKEMLHLEPRRRPNEHAFFQVRVPSPSTFVRPATDPSLSSKSDVWPRVVQTPPRTSRRASSGQSSVPAVAAAAQRSSSEVTRSGVTLSASGAAGSWCSHSA